tara:strand:+ start:1103 stop:2518 length:1416 start_codon:yes stop_codon:yes gene_type:complete
MNKKILAVDLDNTLINTDMSFETLIHTFRKNPIYLFKVFYLFIFHGRNVAKKYLYENTEININDFKINQDVFNYIKKNRDRYEKTILISGSYYKIVKKFFDNLKIFDNYHGSDDNINLVGKNKISFIRSSYNQSEFDYIGDSKKDIPIWEHCNRALIVSSESLLQKLKNLNLEVIVVSKNHEPTLNDFFYLLRLHHWVKNILIFIPMLLAHSITQSNIIILILAFFSYSLVASSIYILNDLADKKFDTLHVTKMNRPITSGKIQIVDSLKYILFILIIGITLALNVNTLFFFLTIFYLFIATCYTLYFKNIAFLDIVILASFFMLRILAGGFAIDINISSWFILFSLFFFLAMASIKRITELQKYTDQELSLNGRPYIKDNLSYLNLIGVLSGLLSMAVFSMYIISESSGALYSNTSYLFIAGVLLFIWLLRVFHLTYKEKMHDDPIIFSMKDKTSYIIVVSILLAFYMAI